MTREERKIRFEVALETVQKVYADYCKDPDVTREQCHDFNDLVVDMIRFSEVLGKEAKEKGTCAIENLPLEGKILEASGKIANGSGQKSEHVVKEAQR